MTGDGLAELRGEGAAIALRIQGNVFDRPAQRAQLPREVAHGREQEGDLLLVMAHIARLVAQLRHEHEVPRRIAGGEAGDGRRQLVAQHEDEVADGRARHGDRYGQAAGPVQCGVVMKGEGSLAALGMTKVCEFAPCADPTNGVIPSAARDLYLI